MKKEYEHLILEMIDGIAVVTINRHEKRNALGAKTIKELEIAFKALAGDEEIAAVVITGAGGKAFCAGAEIEGGFAEGSDVGDFVRKGQEVFGQIERFAKPVVAAVEGYAFGGGCELMLSCDIVVASEKAAIGMPEVGLGLMPGWRGTQIIPRLAGKNAAMEIMLLGGRIRAPRAMELGLVNMVTPKGEALNEAKVIAGKLAKKPAHSIRLIKDAVIRGMELPLKEGLEIEAENFEKAMKAKELKA